MFVSFSTLFVLVLSVSASFGANILGLFAASSRSHVFLGSELLKELANRGHQVTMVSSFPLKSPVKNYRDIFIEASVKIFNDQLGGNHYDFRKTFRLNIMCGYQAYNSALTEYMLQHPNFQKLLKSNEKFDLIIVNVFFNEAFWVFGTHFKAPVIGFASLRPNFLSNDLTGNPDMPAYNPQTMYDFTDRMSFIERLQNTFGAAALWAYRQYIHLPRQQAIVDRNFPGAPTIQAAMRNISLVLSNSHLLLDYPRPIVPAVIPIGGFHLKPTKPLPVHLQEFLDNATDGVIYFSMGSKIKSADFPEEKKQAFLKTFSGLKQQVLWKWEEDNFATRPLNVKIDKWLPQTDILGHPNVKLFITHGGQSSLYESIWRGVPLIGIPIFADQGFNVARIVSLGSGIHLNLDNITYESVSWAVNEILNNPRYDQNIKKHSVLLRDEIVPPMDKAVYWVEYAIRHGGGPHRRTVSLDMNIWEYFLIDVVAFMILIFVVCCLILGYCLKYLYVHYIKLIFIKKIINSENNKSKTQ